MTLIPLGNHEKYCWTMPAIGNSTLKSTKWKVTISAATSVTFDKDECKYIDDNTYSVVVDTQKIGCGPVRIMLEVDIFDADAPTGIRRQQPYFITDDTIVRWDAIR